MSAADDCARVREQLMDFLKQELPANLAADIKRHLDECPPCGDCAEYERRFVALLRRRLSGDCCPDPVRARVLSALRDMTPPA
jgi:anti-sigma factor (TIGR02949 family)